ncbi:hypothetical protein FB451DRAFT_1551135 [Mycena latifolia]|nr:hypothetical protein FB451DRAFT_1551135 [Mycena latifolia]
MKLTLFFASLLAATGLCSAVPSIQERCGSDATITSRSSFTGPEGHEIQFVTASCSSRRQGGIEHSELTKRAATCIPDPATCTVLSCLGAPEPPAFATDCKNLISSVVAFAPNFTVLANESIFITSAAGS